MQSFELDHNDVRCKINSLRTKDGSESETIGALRAIVNVAVDALTPLGIHRGAAILGVQTLSDSLEEVLKALMSKSDAAAKVIKELFNGYGPLATMQARIQIAYVLGIHPDWQDRVLQVMRKLRNAFAHDADDIQKFCERLMPSKNA